MKYYSTILFLLVWPCMVWAGVVKNIRTDKAKSSITYHMHHPMHSWDGINKNVDGVVQYSDSAKHLVKVAILAKVADFNSQNSNRDSHMMEVTEALKYPSISFVSTELVYGDKILVKGSLTFHGVTKPIAFYITDQSSGTTHTVTGSFEFKLTDFKIDPPSLMFVKTDDAVKVDFSMVYVN